MKQIIQFKTRDGVIHNSFNKAECHALDTATKLLQKSMIDACPSIGNSYQMSKELINQFKEHPETLIEIKKWLDDSEGEQDEQDDNIYE